MKLHRFYIGGKHDKRGQLELTKKVWVHDEVLLNQWLKVLRYRVGDELVLFDGEGNDRLYKVTTIEQDSVGFDEVTALEPNYPKKHVYLFWSLLKGDKNDVIIQKCTELGVANFIPIIAKRTEKTSFDQDRAYRIIIEAAEQCGRSDIPRLRQPLTLIQAITEYSNKIDMFVCEQSPVTHEKTNTFESARPKGILVGPEGGWSDEEKEIFITNGLKNIILSDFTLRAETASISAATKLLQL